MGKFCLSLSHNSFTICLDNVSQKTLTHKNPTRSAGGSRGWDFFSLSVPGYLWDVMRQYEISSEMAGSGLVYLNPFAGRFLVENEVVSGEFGFDTVELGAGNSEFLEASFLPVRGGKAG